VLLASLLLHLLVFDAVEDGIGLPAWHHSNERVFTVALTPAPPPREAAPPPPTPAPAQPRRTPARHPHAVHPVPQTPPPVVAAASGLEMASVSEDTPAGEAAPGTSVEPTVAATPASSASAAPATPKPPVPRYKVSPPPSAELQYDVQAQREGQTWHGTGVYRWELGDGAYSVAVEASIRLIFKITVLNSKSEGVINDSGIAPVLYSEKPFRKSLTNTHFQHAAHQITFSASEKSFPYLGGEQDRASILWQLAGIGRADAAQFQPGAHFDIVVAGPRDAEPWQFDVVGPEELELDMGKTQTWHVVRVPKPGSYDSRIDIWFAPQREWYPVRVRYTYTNKDYLDMALSDIAPLAH
jgi:hypothetical protein